MNIVEINKLTKSFGKQTVLNELDLIVREGEIYGFIGPNGAGKTTSIRILLGLLKKDSGSVKLLGGDPWKDSVKLHERIAYVPGDVSLWPNLSGGEVLDFLGHLQGGFNPDKRKELVNAFQLDTGKKCRAYSKGNRQKVALVAALASDAEFLILDEPTSGLDPLMERIFQEYVIKAKKEGRTVLLSSHILAEVEAVCDVVGIIRQGKIVESGSLKELRHLTRTSITVELENSEFNFDNMDGIHDITRNSEKIKFSADGKHMDDVMRTLASMGIKSIIAEPPTLEELFLRHYGEEV